MFISSIGARPGDQDTWKYITERWFDILIQIKIKNKTIFFLIAWVNIYTINKLSTQSLYNINIKKITKTEL